MPWGNGMGRTRLARAVAAAMVPVAAAALLAGCSLLPDPGYQQLDAIAEELEVESLGAALYDEDQSALSEFGLLGRVIVVEGDDGMDALLGNLDRAGFEFQIEHEGTSHFQRERADGALEFVYVTGIEPGGSVPAVAVVPGGGIEIAITVPARD